MRCGKKLILAWFGDQAKPVLGGFQRLLSLDLWPRLFHGLERINKGHTRLAHTQQAAERERKTARAREGKRDRRRQRFGFELVKPKDICRLVCSLVIYLYLRSERDRESEMERRKNFIATYMFRPGKNQIKYLSPTASSLPLLIYMHNIRTVIVAVNKTLVLPGFMGNNFSLR